MTSTSGWGVPETNGHGPAPTGTNGDSPAAEPSTAGGLEHVPDDDVTKQALAFLTLFAPRTRPERRRAYSAVAAEFAALSPREEV